MHTYEELYLPEDKVNEGPRHVASANIGGIDNITFLAAQLLQDPLMGARADRGHMLEDGDGCEFCIWTNAFITYHHTGQQEVREPVVR